MNILERAGVMEVVGDLRRSYEDHGSLGLGVNIGLYAGAAVKMSLEAASRTAGYVVERHPKVINMPLDLALYAAAGLVSPREAVKELATRVAEKAAQWK